MSLQHTRRPLWLTFDCYGTLIQWDEGLQAAVAEILRAKHRNQVDPARFIEILASLVPIGSRVLVTDVALLIVQGLRDSSSSSTAVAQIACSS